MDDSTAAYESLSDKLKNMEPMLRNLELSLGGTKKRLKEEARLRRQAEVAKMEADARSEQAEINMMATRHENVTLREDCEALRQELAHKSRENEKLRQEQTSDRMQMQQFASRIGSSLQGRREERSDASHLMNMDSGAITEMTSNKAIFDAVTTGDDSYSEVLDELETVTEQLISTQQKLWRAEDQLRESEACVQDLEPTLRKARDVKTARQQGTDDDVVLLRELEEIRAELSATKRELEADSESRTREHEQRAIGLRELREQDDRMEMLKLRILELEDSARLMHEQLSNYAELLEESQEENARLVEEVACLRDVLHDSGDRDSDGGATQSSETILRETISKEVKTKVLKEANEVREKEINALREQFKKVFRENTVLNEKIEKLQTGAPSLNLGREDYKLRKEVEILSKELQAAKDEHQVAILQTEASWRKKLEQIMTGEFIPEDILEEMESEMKTAIDSATERVRSLQADKEVMADRIEELERELQFSATKIQNSCQRMGESEANLNDSRDEILRLKKSNTHLTAELEYTTKIMSRMDAECERLTRHHSEIKAELEVALQVIETSGMDSSSTLNSETLRMKEKNHTLATKLDKLKRDYSALLDELEVSREKFLDSQEDIAKKSEGQIQLLSQRIIELEESLEKSRLESKDLSKRLQAAQSKHEDAVHKGEIRGKKMLEADVDILKDTISELEKELKEAKRDRSIQKELKQVKDALSSSRIENKKLEEEMAKVKEAGERTFAAGASNENNGPGRDPDPVEETLISGYPLIRNHSRDPPSARGSIKPNLAVSSDVVGFGHLRLRLEEMVLENELLKEKILGMSQENVDTSSAEELSRLRIQIVSKTREMKDMEEKVLKVRLELKDTEDRLREAENVIDQSEAEHDRMKSEVSALQDALHNARQNEADVVRELERTRKEYRDLEKEMNVQAKTSIEEVKSLIASEIGSILVEVKGQLQKLTDEKASLQHQVDDSKIALSVSQYAQERGKEELKICQSRLSASVSDVDALKNELTKMTSAFSALKMDHEILLAKKSSGFDAHFDSQPKGDEEKLTEQVHGLAELVRELEDALLKSQTEVEIKRKEIESLENNLMSTQEETRLLSEEISNLSLAFEKAQGEYDSVVDELEAVNDIFETACREAEQSGREAAAEEMRTKVQCEKEKEKKSIQLQLEKAFADNISLQKKLDDAETSLIAANRSSSNEDKMLALEKEKTIIQIALIGSQNEVKTLKDKCFDLEMLLNETDVNLDMARNELESSRDGPINPRLLSAVFETEEMQDLKEQFNALIEENINLEQVVRDSEVALTLAADVEERNRQTLNGLEEELSDMRAAKRNLQEQVYKITVEFERSTDNHERILEETRVSIQAEKDAKLKVLKKQIDALLIENAALQSKVRKAEIAMSTARSLHSERLESVNTESKDLKDSLQRLQNEYEASQEENSRLNAQLKEIESSVIVMMTSQQGTSDDIDALVSQLTLSQEESSELKQRISHLYQTLNQKSETLRQLQEDFEQACIEAEQRGRESMMHHLDSEAQGSHVDLLQNELKRLTHEKAGLLKQVDEARISQSLSSIAQEQTIESKAEIVKSKEQDLTALNAEIAMLNDERAATMEVLERTNVLLASVDFLERHHEIHLRTTHSSFVSISQKAEEIRRKVAFLTYALQKSKKEHSDVLLQLNTSKKEAKQLLSKIEKGVGDGGTINSVDDEVMQQQRNELEQRLEATELALKTARESEQRHKIEVELGDKKYQETHKAASYFKEQVISLQEALNFAREDRLSLSAQLAMFNSRAIGLMQEAEERGKTLAVNERKNNNASDTEWDDNNEELVNRYQRLYKENEELKQRLEETEAALAAARDMKSHHEAELKKLESEADKADELQSINKRLNSELHLLRSNLINAKSNREVVRQELESVKQRLDDIRGEENFDRTNGRTIMQKQAEVRLLQSQFKKLTEQSESLAKQVKDAENAVAAVRDKQANLKSDVDARASLTKTLQDQIDEAVDATKKRNREISKLAVMMESRVCLTEESVEKLEQEINATKGSLQVSKAGLFVTSSYERAKNFTKMVQRSTTNPTEPLDTLKQGTMGQEHTKRSEPSSWTEQIQDEDREEDSEAADASRETFTKASSSSPSRTPTKARVDKEEARDSVANPSTISGFAKGLQAHAKRSQSNSPAFRIGRPSATRSNDDAGAAVTSAASASADPLQSSTLGASPPERRRTPLARRSRVSPFLRTLYDVDKSSSASASVSQPSDPDGNRAIGSSNGSGDDNEALVMDASLSATATTEDTMKDVCQEGDTNNSNKKSINKIVTGRSSTSLKTFHGTNEQMESFEETRGDCGTHERE